MTPVPLRPDLAAVAAAVPEGARVLDIGCGNGQLLAWLRDTKGVEGRGIELDAGDVAAAVEHLTRAISIDDRFRDLTGQERDFDPIRGDPRFVAATHVVV